MALDLASLVAGKTAAQIYAELLAGVAAAGIRVTNWRTGGVYKTLLGVYSVTTAQLWQVAQAIASGAFLDTATGPWLTALGADLFQAPRKPSVFAEGTVTLTAATGQGPYTIGAGGLIVATPSGVRFRSTNGAPLTLPVSGAVDVPVKAEVAGAAANVGTSAISRLVSPDLIGVTVDNGSAWQTVAGADEESDYLYRDRLRARWSLLGCGATEDAYRYLSLSASAEVTQVAVLSNWHAGGYAAAWVTCVVCGDGVAISNTALAAVNAALRPPLGVSAEAIKATAQAVTLTATAYVPSANVGEAPGQIAASLDALRRRIPIGGTVYRSQIVDAIHYAPSAVRNVVVAAPTDPLSVPYNRFLTWAPTVTVVGV